MTNGERGTGDGFKWQEAYARLERARRALEGGGERAPEEARRILEDRAKRLARPGEEAGAPSEVLDLLAFSLAGERYAIAAAHAVEAIPLRGLTPVPGIPLFYLGVLNNRGRILPVLDLRRVFNLVPARAAEQGRVVVVEEVAGITFGLYADAVTGILQVRVHDLAPPPAGLAAGHQAFLRGVTADMMAVLDLERLAQDPRITVKEEVG